MVYDTPNCNYCIFFNKNILYKYSCEKYEEIDEKILQGVKKCKYFDDK